MDIVEGIAAVGAAVAGAFLAGRGLRAAQDTVALLFRSPTLTWPRGVQEDDDHHWNWRPPVNAIGTPSADDLDGPEIEDLPPTQWMSPWPDVPMPPLRSTTSGSARIRARGSTVEADWPR